MRARQMYLIRSNESENKMDAINSLPLAPRTGILAIVSIVATSILLWSVKKSKQVVKNVAKVEQIIFYPIKSLQGIKVGTIEVTTNGVKYGQFKDRAMILLNSENRMITQRQEPRLALVKVTLADFDTLKLSINGKGDLLVKPKDELETGDLVHNFNVWGTPTQGVEVDPEASQWFSDILGQQDVKLVQHLPQLLKRPTNCEGSKSKYHDYKSQILYQDGDPLLLTSNGSLDKLNESIEDGKKMSHENFRPNVVIGGCEALLENTFNTLTINKSSFKNVLLCGRCSVPTVDLEEGVKIDSRSQIMKNFRSARTENEKKIYGSDPLFGINLVPLGHGVISVGDNVNVTFK